MEITRQLRRDAVNKRGFAPVQVTICWSGHRLRVGTGERVKPEHWDEATSRVRAVKGSYYDQINPRLDAINNAAEAAQAAAEQRHELLTPAALQAALDQVLKPDQEAPAAASPPPAPRTVLALFQEWITEQAARVSPRTRRPTAKNTLKQYHSTFKRLVAFEEHVGRPLTLEGMDLIQFYAPFRRYVMEDLKYSLNTFGKYIDHVKQFLGWCELDQDLEVNRRYHKFVAPEKYVGVDALTEDELTDIAGLDFNAPELRRQLYSWWFDTSHEGIDGPPFVAYCKQVELARDKFLLCVYTSLSIGDADTVTWRDVQSDRRGTVLVWDRHKTGNACHIPFEDDALFKPVQLATKYRGAAGDLLVPVNTLVNRHLKVVARLVRLERLKLTTKIGRKTFVTLKLFQGVPQRMVMMATGHTTESAFNRYVGVDVLKLLEQFRRFAPAMAA